MDSARRTLSAFRTCGLADQHNRLTTDALWLGPTSGWMAVTASDDGRVKVWDSNTGACLWASEATLRAMVPEPIVKVTASYALGCIVAILRSGEIRVWSGFNLKENAAPLAYASSSTLPCPYIPAEPEDIPEVLSLEIDNTLPSPVLLVAYRHDRLFYRLDLSEDLPNRRVVPFGEEAMGAPSAICPCFSDDPTMSSIVITGDTLGCVNIYRWNSHEGHVTPFHSFEAYRDGSTVTSVAWNGVTLVTGSSRGVTQIFDGVSFERLKKIASPVPAFSHRHGAAVVTQPDRENVHHIILGPGKDSLFVGVGDRVLAWKPGPVSRTLKGGVRGRKSLGTATKKVQSGPAKLSRQHQIKKFIWESKGIMDEEDKHTGHVQGTLNQQRAQLRDLGLSEAEAVEYILMMSREQAEAQAKADAEAAVSAVSSSTSRLSSSSSASAVTAADALSEEELERALSEGMFQDDFAVEQQSLGNISTPTPSSPPTRTPPLGSSPNQGRAALRLAASPSNSKVQVLPAYVPEPMEAAPTTDGVVTASTSPSRCRQPEPDLEDEDDFPVVSSGTPSPAGSDAASSAGSVTSGLSSRRNSTTSSLSDFGGLKRMSPPKGAWSAPLRTSATVAAASTSSTATRGAPGSATSPGRAPGSALVAARRAGVHRSPVASTSRVVVPSGLDDMDDDMRFAIELSLAEARSRGENV
ncbi:hypothetical protein BKA70DRAFT_1373477 [Coprinopsis sp. MPI-PUGE-AT-0042]|nr:hypothetical protein BKA70DRAFT_1373477 [Coprinopsis sp. MPI-PUGE-AT-0042]